MAELSKVTRAKLPDSAFAYVDSKGERRLPIHDEAHTRNALARFRRVKFEDDASRERALRRLLRAARKYGIVPIGFIAGQLESERVRGRGETAAVDVRRLPKGTVTLLLTDIEGSTDLLGRLGDRYALVIDQVRALLRTAVERAGGHVVDARADELFAVFDSAPRALTAALAIQRALREHAWPDGLEVCVRIGMHTGRPTLTDSGYVGLSVNTAARICSTGHGGQIVVSGAARDALGLHEVPGVTFRDLGSHRLHGLPEAVRLYQVDTEDLAREFPPLRNFTTPPPPPSRTGDAPV
jgi:class 3 adenylate cyclase